MENDDAIYEFLDFGDGRKLKLVSRQNNIDAPQVVLAGALDHDIGSGHRGPEKWRKTLVGLGGAKRNRRVERKLPILWRFERGEKATIFRPCRLAENMH